jgi:flagellar hook-associated protein 2
VAGLQLGGLVSGMDTETIIQQLLSIDRTPETRWGYQKVAAQTRQTALRDVETRLKSLKTAASDLGSSLLWTPTQQATSADPTKVGARLTGGAAPGGFNLQVTPMAASAQQTFAWTPQAGASTVSINGVSVSIDPNASVADAAQLINSNAALGVYAIDLGNGQLVLSSRSTGTGGDFTASGTALGAGPISARAAQNAKLSVNGVAQPDQQSNVITGLMPGVELTLKGLTDGTVVDVSNPTVDRGALVSKLKAFVSAYNDVVSFVSDKTSEKRVAKPANSDDAALGALFGDSGLNDMLGDMRVAIGSSQDGTNGAYSILSSIGLSTGATTGSGATSTDSVKGLLSLDETKLNAALDADPLAVQKLLAGPTGVGGGFSASFTSLLTPIVQVGGVLDQRIDSAAQQITDLATRTTDLETRLTAKEALLRKQFTAMEQAMQKSQSTAADLASRLGTTAN